LKKCRYFRAAQRDHGPRRLTGPYGIDHNEMIAIPDMFEQRHACRPAVEHLDRPRYSILPLQLLHDPDTHALIL
jgi:hypothetical protein